MTTVRLLLEGGAEPIECSCVKLIGQHVCGHVQKMWKLIDHYKVSQGTGKTRSSIVC